MEVLATHIKSPSYLLGCARNRVDSEVMLGSLLERNWAVTDDADEADAVIINTCGFIDAAKEESVQTILEASELKPQPGYEACRSGMFDSALQEKLARAYKVDVLSVQMNFKDFDS